MDASGQRIAVIVSRWNELITKELLEGALDELERHGAKNVEVVYVPGSWEIPAAASAMIDRSAENRPTAIVALGCILQGATVHAQILARDVANELMRLQTDKGVPISWGVLTPDDMPQAKERAGLKLGNKGREAALAALEMASVNQQLRS
jgi:6,7-dimethyl-8-ribityllumazine synthase